MRKGNVLEDDWHYFNVFVKMVNREIAEKYNELTQ
jgi:hypothetical protein